MKTINDREHFDSYREQTKVKHDILLSYLRAFLAILKGKSDVLVYIDGFAGRGTYDDDTANEVVEGSPLLALSQISKDPSLKNRVVCIYIESDEVLFTQLETAVNAFVEQNDGIEPPLLCKGKFADHIELLVERIKQFPPTFLFVDPCGVDGVSFKAIKSIMDNDACEAFIFFNLDGVRRIAGLHNPEGTLCELLGSRERACRLLKEFSETDEPEKREQSILAAYIDVLQEDMGPLYITTFRVESEHKRITSHYLIHASKHPLGFKIMKDVMWKRGRDSGGSPALQYCQRSYSGTLALFSPLADVKEEILKELKGGIRPVDYFYEQLVTNPTNFRATSEYRSALLELENEGLIVVIGKDGRTPAPSRPKRNSQKTLGSGHFVKLSNDRGVG